MIDTHSHLYDRKFGAWDAPMPWQGQLEAIDRAVQAGVEILVFPGCDKFDIQPMRQLRQLRPNNVRTALALHPTEFADDWREHLDLILSELTINLDEYIAVGECGIDLYWDQTTLPQQQIVFDTQLHFAATHNLPVLIHCRKAIDQCLEILKGHPDVNAVFHSFEGTPDDVDKIRRVGDYYFGINGIVTFKNTTLRDALPHIGIDRILLETDSPYLAPVPYRGKRNESAYIPHIAAQVASTLNIPLDTVAAATTANAHTLLPRL